MLHKFITKHRDAIISLTRSKVEQRSAPIPTESELETGIPLFLDQLVERLRAEIPDSAEVTATATSHGHEMLRRGFTIAQVVQGYGDICQAVTEVAIEHGKEISTLDFRTLNACLDNATTDAVCEYQRQRDLLASDHDTERLGFFAHELRNHLNTALLSYESLRRGTVGIGGSTGAVLGRSLSSLRSLIDRSLAEVRLEGGLRHHEAIDLHGFMEEVEFVAAFEANTRRLRLTVASAPWDVQIMGDRQILTGVVGNIVQNACKFTRPESQINVTTEVTADRVLIAVSDECGGLPEGKEDDLFKPFQQLGSDRTGLGLGLAISRRGVEANGGQLRVQNRPGVGCTFTVDLPRAPPRTPSAA